MEEVTTAMHLDALCGQAPGLLVRHAGSQRPIRADDAPPGHVLERLEFPAYAARRARAARIEGHLGV